LLIILFDSFLLIILWVIVLSFLDLLALPYLTLSLYLFIYKSKCNRLMIKSLSLCRLLLQPLILSLLLSIILNNSLSWLSSSRNTFYIHNISYSSSYYSWWFNWLSYFFDFYLIILPTLFLYWIYYYFISLYNYLINWLLHVICLPMNIFYLWSTPLFKP
jgi:hypothetical protein